MTHGPFSASLVSTREVMAAPQAHAPQAHAPQAHAPQACAPHAHAPHAYALEAARLVTDAHPHTRRPARYIGTESVAGPLAGVLDKFRAQPDTVFPERYCLILHNVIVAGPGLVFTESPDGGRALLQESAAQTLAKAAPPKGLTRQDANRFTCDLPITHTLPGRYLFLKRPAPNNLALWLVEQAAALALLIDRDCLATPHLILGRIDSPALLDQVCDLVGTLLPGAILHHLPDDEAWRVEQIDYLEPLHLPPLHKHGGALKRLQQHILGAPPTLDPSGPTYFVLQHGGGRTLANEPRILDIAQDFGFTPLDTTHFPARDLAAMFAGARAIVGAKGPAMACSLFAPPGCKVAHISPANLIDPFFWDLASRLDHDYTEIFCRIPAAPPPGRGIRYFLAEKAAVSLFRDITAQAAGA